jgi:hypothetical protein
MSNATQSDIMIRDVTTTAMRSRVRNNETGWDLVSESGLMQPWVWARGRVSQKGWTCKKFVKNI